MTYTMADDLSPQSFRFGLSHDHKSARRPNAPPDLKLISPYFISDTVKSSRNPYTESNPVSATSSVRRCFCNTRNWGPCTCVSSTSTSPLDSAPRHLDNPLAMHSPAPQRTHRHQLLDSPASLPVRMSSLPDQERSLSRTASESVLNEMHPCEGTGGIDEPKSSADGGLKKRKDDSPASIKVKLFGHVRDFKKTWRNIWTNGDDSDIWRHSTYRS